MGNEKHVQLSKFNPVLNQRSLSLPSRVNAEYDYLCPFFDDRVS
jgi:hypothetical protein